jgi:hypothetical protein
MSHQIDFQEAWVLILPRSKGADRDSFFEQASQLGSGETMLGMSKAGFFQAAIDGVVNFRNLAI